MSHNTMKMMILAALFTALTAVGAFLKIPLGFTSITLQVLFTCLAGVLLGPAWGTASQAVYVALGLFGVPIFTMGGGFSYIFQPSMGFLFGLIPMAFTVGMLTRNAADRRHPMLTVFLACVAGEVILYLIGLPYMAAILNFYLGNHYTAAQILTMGCLVYLPGDFVKIAVVTLLYVPLVRALRAAKVSAV